MVSFITMMKLNEVGGVYMKRKRSEIAYSDISVSSDGLSSSLNRKNDNHFSTKRRGKNVVSDKKIDDQSCDHLIDQDTTISLFEPPTRKKRKSVRARKAECGENVSAKQVDTKNQKSRKNGVDKNDFAGIIQHDKKVKRGGKKESSVGDPDECKKGSSRKRIRHSPKSRPKFETEYQFKDAFSVIGGDARTHFLRTFDEGHEGYLWCPKFGYRMGHKMCGVYVTPKCKRKLKCDNYEYGLEIKHRYRLKMVVDKEGNKKDVTVQEEYCDAASTDFYDL